MSGRSSRGGDENEYAGSGAVRSLILPGQQTTASDQWSDSLIGTKRKSFVKMSTFFVQRRTDS